MGGDGYRVDMSKMMEVELLACRLVHSEHMVADNGDSGQRLYVLPSHSCLSFLQENFSL